MKKLNTSVRQQTLARLRAAERRPPLRAAPPVRTVRVQLHLDMTLHLSTALPPDRLRATLQALLAGDSGAYAVDGLCESLTESLVADDVPSDGFTVTAKAWEVSP